MPQRLGQLHIALRQRARWAMALRAAEWESFQYMCTCRLLRVLECSLHGCFSGCAWLAHPVLGRLFVLAVNFRESQTQVSDSSLNLKANADGVLEVETF